jgi:hypothetical protein
MFIVPAKKENEFYTDEIAATARELIRWFLFKDMFGQGILKLLRYNEEISISI